METLPQKVDEVRTPGPAVQEFLDIRSGEVKKKLTAIAEFQAVVKQSLRPNHDYGVIPGTDKPTLLKPGAEKIAKLLNLEDNYEIVSQTEDWDKPFFHYVIRCRLSDIGSGLGVSSGLGECNSWESKYRFRWIPEWKLSSTQAAVKDTVPSEDRKYRTKSGTFKCYRFDNDDIFSQVNTLLKMAKKRALVDAALSVGRLSDLFTQDMEDSLPPDVAEAVPAEEIVDEGGNGGQRPAAAQEHKTITHPDDPISEKQLGLVMKLYDGLVKHGQDPEYIRHELKAKLEMPADKKLNSLKDLTKGQASIAIEFFKGWVDQDIER